MTKEARDTRKSWVQQMYGNEFTAEAFADSPEAVAILMVGSQIVDAIQALAAEVGPALGKIAENTR